MLSKFASSQPPTKKVRLTVRAPPPGSLIKIFVENEQGEISEIQECSPLNSQDEQSLPVGATRFPWKSIDPVQPLPKEEENWLPPKNFTIPYFIFNHVKGYLAKTTGWDGEDKVMKTSDAMKTLLQSGRTLDITKEGRNATGRSEKRRAENTTNRPTNIEKTEVIAVKFGRERITWTRGGGIQGICEIGNCWKNIKIEGKCAEHSDCHTTHFLIRDDKNSTPTYYLLTSSNHSPQFVQTLDKCIQAARKSTNHKAFSNYESKRRDEGHNPQWKLVGPRPWILRSLEYSKIFKQTVNIILTILTTINIHEASQIQIIGDQFHIDSVDWTVVRTILESCGFQLGLEQPSESGTMSESPLLKKSELNWMEGDEWIYMKFGTIGRIYVGTVKQCSDELGRGPMPHSFVHYHHSPDAKGIPIFQCTTGSPQFIKEETTKMEGVGQMGVIICEMLEGTIDEHPIKIDFTKYEAFSDWEEHHLSQMKSLVGFWSSQELEFTPPKTLDVSAINWDPLKKYFKNPDVKVSLFH